MSKNPLELIVDNFDEYEKFEWESVLSVKIVKETAEFIQQFL